jgi:5-formyltetrahydrofolate cyclo-ligase
MLKQEAREYGLATRMALTAHEQAMLDGRIIKNCQEAVDWAKIRKAHVYLPLARKREIGTWALVRWLWAVHPEIEVFVPRITKDGMEHVAMSHDTRFRPNQYQVPEPVSGEMLSPGEKLDVIITPLLAFDRKGHRVGYGAGYYDRFLAEHPEALRVGLAYSTCCIDSGIESEDHDMPLNMVLTELEILKLA